MVIRDELRPGRRLVMIGGGFIGLETAASARTRGCEVTVIEAAPRILMRGVPAELARRVEARHREAGVALKTGVTNAKLQPAPAGSGYRLALSDGSELECDAILAGIGAVPDTALAADCGLAIDNGIAADDRLRTSDPHIYAVGDCCSFPHPLYGGRRIRLESWRNAGDQGMHLAGGLLGEDEPYGAGAWVWADQ